MRLNKIIAKSINCTRKEADLLIKKGSVIVNGKIITGMGLQTLKEDIILVNGKNINNTTKKYILLNKPKKYSCYNLKENITSQLITEISSKDFLAVEKLKLNETGLTLFTNDYELIHKIKTSERIKKIYHITLNKELTQEKIDKLIREKETINIRKISYVQNKNEIGIEIVKGDLQLLKKVFSVISHEIQHIDIVCIGVLTKKNLPRKNYRYLTNKEINILKRS